MNIRYLLLVPMVVGLFHLSHAQVKTISLKKGEAVDLLLLTTNKNAAEEQKEYFSKAVGIAQKWGYKPQYSSKVSLPPTQGNYWPAVFIIAKWEDYDKRIKFTEDILKEYPQFHERRRIIWPSFNLTYWKVKEDREINIDPDLFYIATSYWSDEQRAFASFKDDWAQTVKSQGGKIVLEFKDGTSPFGYYYNPEFFTITEWASKEDFEKFHEKNQAMDHTGVKHVNQFILQ